MLNETSKDFKILGKSIPKGEGVFLELEVAKLHTRNTLKIPIIVERAKLEGPTVLLLGGVHGDEVNGVAIAREIIRRKINKPKRGIVICIPVLNVFGYLNLQRSFPDGRDLNRVFPGTRKGSLASQFAYKFTKEIAPLVDYIIDFHTGGSDRENYPQLRCNFKDTKSMELARIFSPKIILNSPYIAKTLRDTINKMGKTYLLFEGGKSNSINEKVIQSGVNGTINVLNHLGMNFKEETISNTPILINSSKWLRAPYSGMFRLKVENGSWVNKKDILGEITDPYGEFINKVVSPIEGFIFCVNTAPIVNKGDALFNISTSVEQ